MIFLDVKYYKENLYEDILKTIWGNEYVKNQGILKKDIMDGYDAGWLSPDGEFYAQNGETSSMIHLSIAEEMFHGMLKEEMEADGVDTYSPNAPDQWLADHGWMKIHNNECYGYYAWKKDIENTKLYCPTETQIKMICDYVDKFYSGKIYVTPRMLSNSIPINTYKIRQMDEMKLHETFAR